MNSSIVAGERRWASQRRGGMTVLGKVTAPKPINLPSQRLENHGLDPNVEIVPKGTVSWGSRSSSSGSSPWTSSSLSPNADGGTVSPSHRPSSGGSGTRPSTSGSDRNDSAPNAWASNSRPSSASGNLSTNQTSPSLRPRSVENRPNSSQLSRFAEPASKTSAAWGSSATAERLGVKSFKEDSFSLTSGDFPTLGSEKDNPVKSIDSEDCRPTSDPGIVQEKDNDTPHADIQHETVNTWRADTSPHADDDHHPQRYFNNNPNAAPQQFDRWRGPPMNGPAGGWYGGRPHGPPFGPHVHPGGFPMEPFPYYRPQIPPPPLTGPQPVPPPGQRGPHPPGQHGPHPKNGDLYRPQMHEAYPRPGMPFRPNFYPGPPGPMPFEGYYGPPDMPYMGPPVYNGYPSHPLDVSNSHGGRGGGRGPPGKTVPEQVEPERMALKSRNEYEREEGGRWEQNRPPNMLHNGRNRFPASSRRNEWGDEVDAEEAVSANKNAPVEMQTRIYGNRNRSADGSKVKSFEGAKGVVDDNWTNKSEGPPSFPPVVREKDASLPHTTKNSELMHKIDGLNAKFRVSDGLNEGNQRTGFQTVDSNSNNNYQGQVSNTAPNEANAAIGVNETQPISVVSRKPYHGGNPRVDNRGKGKFNADGWQRKPLNSDSSSAVTPSNNESTPNIHSHGPNHVVEPSSDSIINQKDSVEDSADVQAQRVKMKEIAKQRALQLQKEEEERVREQKAKALAKLEELDRRKTAGEAKGERALIIGDIRIDQRESHTAVGTVIAELKTNESGFSLVVSPAVTSAETDGSRKGLSESNAELGDGSVKNVVSQSDDGAIARNKRVGYTQKQSNTSLKNPNEVQKDPLDESPLNVNEPPLNDTSNSNTNTVNASNSVVEPSSQQRKRFNKSNKPKPKPDETIHDNGGSNNPIPNSGDNVLIEVASSMPNEESQNKISNQFKPQPHPTRRIPKNQQPHRFADKHHASDTVVWAPKAKGSDEASQNSAHESTKGNNVNSLKGKRAEMERYVPKPQLAQQGNSPSLSSSVGSNEAAVSEQSNLEINVGDNINSKNKREHGNWKQRGLKDSIQSKESSTSEPAKEIQKPNELVQFGTSEVIKIAGPDLLTDTVTTKHPSTGRGKRHQTRAPKCSGEIDVDKSIVSKESRSFGERTTSSQWQPKSNPNPANNRNGESESASLETTRVSKKENPQPQSDVADDSTARNHQNIEKAKIPSAVKGRPNSQSGRQNNRPIRGHEARGEWEAKQSTNDNRPHGSFRERQRQNVHLEYQPVGPLKNHKPEKIEERADEGERERGQNRPKYGGNYYRR